MKKAVIVEVSDCTKYMEKGEISLRCNEDSISLESSFGVDELEVIRDNGVDEYFNYGDDDQVILLLITPDDAKDILRWYEGR